MAKIALIDTMIEKELLKKDIDIKTLFLCEPKPEAPPYRHGTVCMKILESITEDYEILNIVIMEDEQKKVSIDRLTKALEHCLMDEPDIISMSIGTTCLQDFKKLDPIIHKLDQKGILLVAAQENSKRVTWPASMKQVIGVTCDWNMRLETGEIRRIKKNLLRMDIVVNSNLEFSDEPVSFEQSNSYAVPIVVSFLNTCINRGIRTKETVLLEIDKTFGKALSYSQIVFSDSNIRTEEDCPIVVGIGIKEDEMRQIIDLLWKFHRIEAIGITEKMQSEDFTLLARKIYGNEIEQFLMNCLQKDIILFGLGKKQLGVQWDVLIQGEEKRIILQSAEDEIYMQSKDEDLWIVKLVRNLVYMLTENIRELE